MKKITIEIDDEEVAYCFMSLVGRIVTDVNRENEKDLPENPVIRKFKTFIDETYDQIYSKLALKNRYGFDNELIDKFGVTIHPFKDNNLIMENVNLRYSQHFKDF